MTSQISNRRRTGRALSVTLAIALAAGAGGAMAKGRHAPAEAASVEAKAKTISDGTSGLTRLDGLLPVYVDKSGGRILLSLPAPDAEGLTRRWRSAPTGDA